MREIKFKISIILLLVSVMGIAALVGIAQSENTNNKADNFDDNLNLVRIFRLVNGLNKEAEKQETKGFAKRAEMLRNYFQKKTGISNDAKLKFNELATNFQKESEKVNVEMKEVRKNQKNKPNDEALNAEFEKLRETRNKLFDVSREFFKNDVFKDDSEKVLNFLREEILGKMKNTKKSKSTKDKFNLKPFQEISYEDSYDESFIEGYSWIEYDSVNNEVWSGSTTNGLCYVNNQESERDYECSATFVSAVLTDEEGIGSIADEMYGTENFAEVYLFTTPTVDGNYCVDGEHYIEDNNNELLYAQSSDCMNVELPQEISSLEFEEIDSPIDDNPTFGNHTLPDGKRIFPDKETPSDTTNRAKVRIKATISPVVENVEVHFKSFDLDDPSSNALPLDDETLAEDNRGEVNGNKEGVLDEGGNTITAVTDSNGVASVVLTVTKQPGDNFAVVASKDGNYLANISVQGVELKNGSQTVSTSETTSQNPAIRTEMLTVWRKFHIEVDDMGVVTNNKETGTISSAILLGGTAIELKLDKILEEKKVSTRKDTS